MRFQARSTAAIRYRFDEVNRLTIRHPGGAAGRLRSIRVLEGRVTTDRHNRLIYRVDAPVRGRNGSRRYELDGTWALTRRHALKLTLHDAARNGRQTLYLKGVLEQVGGNALTVALRHSTRSGGNAIQRITLTGRWQADRRNRLTFLVQKADGSEDRLTLRGTWRIGRHHTLEYRYREPTTASRSAVHTLRFAGVWDLEGATRLVYRLDRSTDSAFVFRAALQTKSLNAREGRLVYQVGVRLERRRTSMQRVVLFGVWKVHRDLSITFEVPYAGGRRSGLRFTATYALTERDQIAVHLNDRHGRRRTVTHLTV